MAVLERERAARRRAENARRRKPVDLDAWLESRPAPAYPLDVLKAIAPGAFPEFEPPIESDRSAA